MLRHLKKIVAGSLAGASIMVAASAAAAPVSLELVLLVDASGSVDATEYELQKQGYVQAFRSAAVQNAIFATPGGAIAVMYAEWSSPREQDALVTWRLINSVESANAFATLIDRAPRIYSGSTAPGNAIQFATRFFGPEVGGGQANGFESLRQVIDVSGDGAQNGGLDTKTQRDLALSLGVDAINGLPILDGDPSLLTFYQNNIQGGAGSFTLASNTFADFNAAIQQKLTREITGGNNVPEPGSLALFGLALGALGVSRRRRPGK